MGRDRLVRIGGLNIRVHTQHKAEEYVSLWRAMYRLRLPTARGVNALMIGTVTQLGEDSNSPLLGSIYRFTDIDPNDPWFDIEQHKRANDEDVAEVNIPQKLKGSMTF
jgi:hypothetical protein